jgi:hypothetical protein
MRAAGEEGAIVFRGSIDSTGVPDSTTFRVVQTSATVLVAPTRAAVAYRRFAPPVSRAPTVELPFTFTLSR